MTGKCPCNRPGCAPPAPPLNMQWRIDDLAQLEEIRRILMNTPPPASQWLSTEAPFRPRYEPRFTFD